MIVTWILVNMFSVLWQFRTWPTSNVRGFSVVWFQQKSEFLDVSGKTSMHRCRSAIFYCSGLELWAGGWGLINLVVSGPLGLHHGVTDASEWVSIILAARNSLNLSEHPAELESDDDQLDWVETLQYLL
jgi:hypothetical protein